MPVRVHPDQAMLFNLADIPEENPPTARAGALAKRFVIPPFTRLDAVSGEWRKRKRAWLDIGIQSELGRGDVMKAGGLYAGESEWAGYRGPKMVGLIPEGKVTKTKGKAARSFRLEDGDSGSKGGYASLPSGGTSVFDPVLCELVYRWFCSKGGRILDPFAGGSVRGIVAAMLERNYTGIDLSLPQVEANRAQAEDILTRYEAVDYTPTWINGDSLDVRQHTFGLDEFDLIFTCPPYADLEVYSDDPRDLSNMEYPQFKNIYRQIIANAATKLKNNRFAAIVVGDVRGPDGCYRSFVSHTIDAFIDAGLKLYNEAVLLTSLGSLPIRTSAQFAGGRKLGKAHQNILIFVKGDWQEAVKACPLELLDTDIVSWEAATNGEESYRSDEPEIAINLEATTAEIIAEGTVLEGDDIVLGPGQLIAAAGMETVSTVVVEYAGQTIEAEHVAPAPPDPEPSPLTAELVHDTMIEVLEDLGVPYIAADEPDPWTDDAIAAEPLSEEPSEDDDYDERLLMLLQQADEEDGVD
jgi:hypothetical protein